MTKQPANGERRLEPWFLSLPVVVLVAACLLLVPLLLRVLAGNPLIPGPASYSHLRPIVPSLYDLLFAPLGELALLASVLFGIAAALLFRSICERLFQRREDQGLALLLFLINPLFLSVFTSLSPYSLAIPIALLCILVVHHRRRFLTPLLVVLTAALSPLFAAVLLAFLFLLGGNRRVLFVSFLLAVPASLLAGQWPGLLGIQMVGATTLVAEFGAPVGVSFLYVAFALFEGVARWNERRGRAAFLLFLILCCLTPFAEAARIAVSLLSVTLAARFLTRLTRRRWHLQHARGVTFLLAACLLLFLLLTHILLIASEQPTRDLVRTLAALPPDNSAVLAPPALGPIIEALTTHTALPGSCVGADAPGCTDILRLYGTMRLPEAEQLLQGHGIEYLLITQEMRNGGVWNRDDEGLLFLLNHSGRFVKIASDPEEELWLYIPSPPLLTSS